ncbi:MAG: glutathione S-transferase family protein [Alphaproteobacteria bacterium]|nr:glutathione S-transferase family protein [Alphaproteobacteria bacterium]
MAAVKIYGTSGSRALRSLWMAEELKREAGFEYELVPTHFMKDAKQPAYLAINPNGRVPAMDDNGFILFESLAINLYLAKQYGRELAPRTVHEEALAIQWSMWALTELEDSIIALVVRHPKIAMMPPDEKLEGEARAKLDRPLKVLELHMAEQRYMLGERFTVADVNVAGVLSLSAFAEVDLSPYPNVKTWFDASLARPSFAAARAR